jgi:hypothetical protein
MGFSGAEEPELQAHSHFVAPAHDARQSEWTSGTIDHDHHGGVERRKLRTLGEEASDSEIRDRRLMGRTIPEQERTELDR